MKANKLRSCKNLDSKPGRHVGTPHCLLGRQWEEENMGEGVQQKEMRWSIDQIKKVGARGRGGGAGEEQGDGGGRMQAPAH